MEYFLIHNQVRIQNTIVINEMDCYMCLKLFIFQDPWVLSRRYCQSCISSWVVMSKDSGLDITSMKNEIYI